MTFIGLLVLLLVVLAGIIAFAGDRLGTYVGRRRLSLFGARPRRTGQIVGIMAGILIMLTTLGVLAVAFQNATQTLLNFQRTLDELTQLRTQERILNERVREANLELEALRSELEQARETIRTAEQQRDAALEARDAAQRERDDLLAQRDDLAEQVAAAVAEVDAAEARLLTTQQDLDQAMAEADQARDDRDEALTEADQARAAADEAQAEAVRLEQEIADARSQLDDANEQLRALQEDLVDVELRLAAAEAQVLTAQQDLQQAEAARAEAEAARDDAVAVRDEALSERDEAIGERESALEERDAAQRESADLAGRLASLNAEVSDLESSTEDLRAQAQTLREQNQSLLDANDALAEDNARIQQQNRSLSDLNDRLEDEIRQRNETVQTLQATVDELRAEVEGQARDLAELQQQYGRFEGGEVYFVKDQLIYSGAIYAQEPAAVREELASFISDATAFVARRGVERIRVTTEQFNVLVEVISQTPESDLVRLISPSNQISSTIDVLVEALENDELFQGGQLIVSNQLHVGTTELPASQDEIRTALAQLKADAVRKMRRAGLDEGQLADFGPVTEEMFTNLLLRLTGPVTVGLVATEPVNRAGPARLELMILY
ncbi:MAG: DUF3084 domain-containing protein [Trueperaceae bacterium]